MVLIVTGNHDEKNYDSLSIIDHVNIYLIQGYNTKEAIKKVAKDRNVKTSEIYNEYHGIKQVDL